MSTIVPPTTDSQEEDWVNSREFWVDQFEAAKIDLAESGARTAKLAAEVMECKAEIERIDEAALATSKQPGGDT